MARAEVGDCRARAEEAVWPRVPARQHCAALLTIRPLVYRVGGDLNLPPTAEMGPGGSRASKSFSSRLLLGCSRLKLCLADRLMASNGAANEDICAGVMTGACCRRNALPRHVALEVAAGKLKNVPRTLPGMIGNRKFYVKYYCEQDLYAY